MATKIIQVDADATGGQVFDCRFVVTDENSVLFDYVDGTVTLDTFGIVDSDILVSQIIQLLCSSSVCLSVLADAVLAEWAQIYQTLVSVIAGADTSELLDAEGIMHIMYNPHLVEDLDDVALKSATSSYIGQVDADEGLPAVEDSIGFGCSYESGGYIDDPTWVIPGGDSYVARPYLEFDNIVSLYIDLTAQYPIRWTGQLFYSTDTLNWNPWDGSLIYSDTETHKLYLRGEGNTCLGVNRAQMDSTIRGLQMEAVDSSGVGVHGNLETLLDWSTVLNGGSPDISQYNTFSYLFAYCPINCCPELSAAPRIMKWYTYYALFSHCTKLKYPGSIKSYQHTESGNYAWMCYYYLYWGCTHIRVSSTRDTTYKYRWTSLSMLRQTDVGGMFYQTGGNNPAASETVYIADWPAGGEPTEVDIVIETDSERTQVFHYYQARHECVLVDWGDGTQTALEGEYDSSTWSHIRHIYITHATHEYAQLGTYTVKFIPAVPQLDSVHAGSVVTSDWGFGYSKEIYPAQSGATDTKKCAYGLVYDENDQVFGVETQVIYLAFTGQPKVVNYTVRSIRIGDYMETLDTGSLIGCVNLSTIDLGISLKHIGSYALAGTAISEVDMPESLLTVGQGICYMSRNLNRVVMGNYITKFGKKITEDYAQYMPDISNWGLSLANLKYVQVSPRLTTTTDLVLEDSSYSGTPKVVLRFLSLHPIPNLAGWGGLKEMQVQQPVVDRYKSYYPTISDRIVSYT